MQQISKSEKEFLMKNKLIQMIGGRYPDLTITGRKSKRKKYYVPDYIKAKLKRNSN